MSEGQFKLSTGGTEPSPPPREQPYIQSAGSSGEPVRAPKYHNPDLVM